MIVVFIATVFKIMPSQAVFGSTQHFKMVKGAKKSALDCPFDMDLVSKKFVQKQMKKKLKLNLQAFVSTMTCGKEAFCPRSFQAPGRFLPIIQQESYAL